MDFRSNHGCSLGIGCRHLVNFGNLSFIYIARYCNVYLLANGYFGQIVFGNFYSYFDLFIAFNRKEFGSFGNGCAFQKAAALGRILGCGYGGNFGDNAGEFGSYACPGFFQLIFSLGCRKLGALCVCRQLLFFIRIGNSRFRGGFLAFSLIDFFIHIIQFLLFCIDKALFFFQLFRHAQIADLVIRFADAVIQVLDDLLNTFSRLRIVLLLQLIRLCIQLLIQFSQPILQLLLFLLLLVLQLVLQSLYILFLLLCQYLQLRQTDCCFIIFRLIFIALILGTFIAVCCYGRIQLRFRLLHFQICSIKGNQLLSLCHLITQGDAHFGNGGTHRRIICFALLTAYRTAGG